MLEAELEKEKERFDLMNARFLEVVEKKEEEREQALAE